MRALAALLRAGVSPRCALCRWHDVAPARLRPVLELLAGRVHLGAELPAAMACLDEAFGHDAEAMGCAFAIAGETGGNLAVVVDRLASATEDRAAAAAAGNAAGAGARLSGRIVAGLPLLLIPFAPASHAPLLDPLGVAMVCAGGVLAVAGLSWVGRLVPVPPDADPDGVPVVDVLAAALDGGASIHAALEAVARHAPSSLRVELTEARRLVQMGLSWPEALKRTRSDPLVAISAELERAVALGTPVSTGLRRWSAAQRADCRRRFDAALRRAPVLMVVPLSLCVLPAYALLGLGPYLRALL